MNPFELSRVVDTTGLILFLVFFLVAMTGNILYFWIRRRVEQAGVKVKWYVTVPEMIRMFRAYRELALEQGWSLWPIVASWVILAALFLLFIAIAFRLLGK